MDEPPANRQRADLRAAVTTTRLCGPVMVAIVMTLGIPLLAPSQEAKVGGLADAPSTPSATRSPLPTYVVTARARLNPVVLENRNRGSSGWRLGQRPYQLSGDRDQQVEGYAWATSVEIGQELTLSISVWRAQMVRADIYRLGWYQGLGGRRVSGGIWVSAMTQPRCRQDATIGLTVCHWPAALKLAVPRSWTSGLYLVALTSEDGYQAAVPFTVRDDARPSSVIYVQPVTTYEAYNAWPTDGSGRSLYFGGPLDGPTIGGTTAAVEVSFDRPYTATALIGVWEYDQPLVEWLERSGYDVTYATSIDLDTQGARLLAHHRAMVSVGHDEYWTRPMVDAVYEARQDGISLAFLGADNLAWQARLAPGEGGVRDRVLVCYRRSWLDPEAYAALKTVRWRDPPVSRPEQLLLGAQYTDMVGNPAPFIVRAAHSWVYAGTGLHDGDRIPGLVGGEADRVFDGPRPDSRSFTILSDSPFRTRYGGSDAAEATLYQALSGAWVFDAGTFMWANLVGPDAAPDARVQRITANLLEAMVLRPTPRRSAVMKPT